KRVLGVIRPTSEIIGDKTNSGHVGVLATNGTVASGSYPLEIAKFFPGVKVSQQACPIWVPLIENNEHNTPGASYFIGKHVNALMEQDPEIDTVLLACTHYPLIKDQIASLLPGGVAVLSQGDIVASSLTDYLGRHPEMEKRISRGAEKVFYTTDSTADFDKHASIFYGSELSSKHLSIS
ncbi:MAG: glutamate racemase, partial [Chitinophagaceae bacterium]